MGAQIMLAQATNTPPDIVLWTDAVQAVAEAAGAVGTLAALVFLGLQLRSQTRALQEQRESSTGGLKALAEQVRLQVVQAGYVAEQTRLQTEQTNLLSDQLNLVAMTNKSMLYQDLTKEMQRITSIFLERPRLRRYFYDNIDVPTECVEREEVRVVSEMFVDFISSSVNTNALFDEKQRTVWTTYFREIAGSSPAMREFWCKNRHWYEPSVQAVLDPVALRSASGETRGGADTKD
jgi:hypothetical protein